MTLRRGFAVALAAVLTVSLPTFAQTPLVGPADHQLLGTGARMVILAPSLVPQIHGPRVIGATPGYPFLFLIPATGRAPLTFTAFGLPPGLTLNKRSGIISGAVVRAGHYDAEIRVASPYGKTQRILTIVAGPHDLAQTPPMGWSSEDAFGRTVDEVKIKATADAMVNTGLAAHGYCYVNIDDSWQGTRDSRGNIRANGKFPNMQALARTIHSKGLKLGLYTSAGPKTCGGFLGSYEHEDIDAATYAAWGVDLLKYDWCNYKGAANRGTGSLQSPYAVMRTSLDKVRRDIVYSICQPGPGKPWDWSPSFGANLWRAGGDADDRWPALMSVFESENGREADAGLGHWNDPGLLSVGYLNSGRARLTKNEQITQFSMWCLVGAPLIIGGDVTRLDSFTTALLTNDDAIDIDQDPLGHAAGRAAKDGNAEVWARPLFDGTHAVGLVNIGDVPTSIAVYWSEIGIRGAQPVYDVWLHKNVGTLKRGYAVQVPPHACALLIVGTPQESRKIFE